MYARPVQLDGCETIWVNCTPDTPDWEVLERAAKILRQRRTRK